MEGICLQCNIRLSHLQGNFCPRRGEKLFVRTNHHANLQHSNTAAGCAASFDESRTKHLPNHPQPPSPSKLTSEPASDRQEQEQLCPRRALEPTPTPQPHVIQSSASPNAKLEDAETRTVDTVLRNSDSRSRSPSTSRAQGGSNVRRYREREVARPQTLAKLSPTTSLRLDQGSVDWKAFLSAFRRENQPPSSSALRRASERPSAWCLQCHFSDISPMQTASNRNPRLLCQHWRVSGKFPTEKTALKVTHIRPL